MPLVFPTPAPADDVDSLVLSTLDEALADEPDRKCFRLVGGVLVERTVKDVVPALKTNRDGVSFCSSWHSDYVPKHWYRSRK